MNDATTRTTRHMDRTKPTKRGRTKTRGCHGVRTSHSRSFAAWYARSDVKSTTGRKMSDSATANTSGFSRNARCSSHQHSAANAMMLTARRSKRPSRSRELSSAVDVARGSGGVGSAAAVSFAGGGGTNGAAPAASCDVMSPAVREGVPRARI
eukprot:8694-Pelagococcus_subviridis.AAC.8